MENCEKNQISRGNNGHVDFYLSDHIRDDLLLYGSYDDAGGRALLAGAIRGRRFSSFKRAMGYVAVLLAGIVLATVTLIFSVEITAGKHITELAEEPYNKAYLELESGDFFVLGNDKCKVVDSDSQIATNNMSALDIHALNSMAIQELRRDMSSEGNIMHRLVTSQGSDFKVVLTDGTNVHMNSCSQLLFPAKFDNDTPREVYLSGEAYFDVAKSELPFIIKTDFANVEVIGTQFNLRCHKEDGCMAVTLQQGIIVVEAAGNKYRVSPGQELRIREDGSVTVSWPDTDYSYAWIYGMLAFDDEPLTDIVRKLSYWYPEKIEIVCDPDERFTGWCGRRPKNLYEAIDMLGLEEMLEVSQIDIE